MKKTLLTGLAILSMGLITTGVLASKNNVKIVYGYTSGDVATYYDDISSSSKGDALLTSLRTLNDKKLRSLVGYGSMMTYFKQTDPGTSSGKVTSFYSGKSVSSSDCNREHVWPDSHGGNIVEGDIHMVRPALKEENSSRGNSFYVEGMNHQYDGWDPANEGVESYRGDSARIIFYCVVADSRLSLLDVNKHYTTSENNDYKMGKLSDLLKWNLQYPVQQREKTRNEAAERLQGNRNPFIDHPEYACRIWGKTNDATKKACGLDTVSEFTLSASKKTMEVGKAFRLDYVIEPEDFQNELSVSWESSNPDVASIDSGGLIRTLTKGKTIITATLSSYFLTATCELTVVNSGENITPTKASGGCGGSIATTSMILSTLSFIGIGLFLVKRKGI